MKSFITSFGYFWRAIRDYRTFAEIKRNPVPIAGIVIFVLIVLTIALVKLIVAYPQYKIYLLEQLDRTVQELRSQGATEEELEAFRRNALNFTTLPFLLITTLTVEFFRQPVGLLIQAFALLLVFLRYKPFAEGTFKHVFSTVVHSKGPLLMGGVLSVPLAWITGNPGVNFSPALFLTDSNLKSVFFHLDIFSLWSLYVLAMGLVYGFGFARREALTGVFGMWGIFFLLNAFYVYVLRFF